MSPLLFFTTLLPIVADGLSSLVFRGVVRLFRALCTGSPPKQLLTLRLASCTTLAPAATVLTTGVYAASFQKTLLLTSISSLMLPRYRLFVEMKGVVAGLVDGYRMFCNSMTDGSVGAKTMQTQARRIVCVFDPWYGRCLPWPMIHDWPCCLAGRLWVASDVIPVALMAATSSGLFKTLRTHLQYARRYVNKQSFHTGVKLTNEAEHTKSV